MRLEGKNSILQMYDGRPLVYVAEWQGGVEAQARAELAL
jgi:hypothetical protein